MADQPTWLFPPHDLRLRQNEVHIWKAHLDLGPALAAQFSEVLSDLERSRAERFIFDIDRSRFVVARSVLRILLARYLNGSAETIEFVYGPNGKPGLRANSDIRFNLAHSGGLALYAFSRGPELGLDVESRRRFTNLENAKIVQSYFSTKEQAEFNSLDPIRQQTAFYLGWTRKEAYLKARGAGLQMRLQSFDVSLTPGGPARLTSEDASKWELHSFCLEPDFVAALVVERANSTLRYWEWSLEAGV